MTDFNCGVMLTTDVGKEFRAIKDCSQLIELYANPEASKPNDQENEPQSTDIRAQLEEELKDKRAPKLKVTSIKTGVRGVLFLLVKQKDIDIVEVVRAIVNDPTCNSKFIHRLLPIVGTCNSNNLSRFKQIVINNVAPRIKAENWGVLFKIRNNTTWDKQDFVEVLLEAMEG
jgi:hypothetical protein